MNTISRISVTASDQDRIGRRATRRGIQLRNKWNSQHIRGRGKFPCSPSGLSDEEIRRLCLARHKNGSACFQSNRVSLLRPSSLRRRSNRPANSRRSMSCSLPQRKLLQLCSQRLLPANPLYSGRFRLNSGSGNWWIPWCLLCMQSCWSRRQPPVPRLRFRIPAFASSPPRYVEYSKAPLEAVVFNTVRNALPMLEAQ